MSKYALRDYQLHLVAAIFAHWKEGRKRVLLQSGTGTGKCLVKGTPILMFDGTIKPVEEIMVGDVLMGDDSTPRNVLSTTTGRERCYDIVPVKGDTWGCNGSHILSLVCNGNSGAFKKGHIYDIELREYLALSKSDRHVLKQYRVGVEFQPTETSLPPDPYFLGLWLGDGTCKQVSISNPDTEIIDYLRNFGTVRNMEARAGKCPVWLFPAAENKALIAAFKDLNLLKNKHIPQSYKTASREIRLQLLAGILDTDGHFSKGGFELIAKSDTLANDILFLARSLGFAAYMRTKHVKLKGWEESRPYNRIFISGDTSEIPMKIARKKGTERGQIKDVLRTGFTVAPRGQEQYYGFEIDGNRRFVLGDFTVTHNTVMFNHIVNLAHKKDKRVLVIADRRELITQTWQRLWDAHGIHAGIIMSGHPQSFNIPVQIGSVQTLNRRTFPPDIDLIVIDECRSSTAPTYKPIFDFYKDAHFLGVDATPVRTSGKGFDHLYDALVCGPSIKAMEQQGALLPAKSFINPIKQTVLDKIKITAGDYNEQQLARAMSADNITADLVASWRRHAAGKKTLVFAVDIAHSKAIVAQYKKAGIEAAHVDGSFSTEQREAVFKALKTGRILILCNVGIATYGVDFPWLEAVQLARPTKSLALFLQMVGRGARPFAGMDYYLLLDHANCIMEHGQPNAERKWTLRATATKKPKAKKFIVKQEGRQMMIMNEREAPMQANGVELIELTEETMAFYKNCKKFDTIHRRQVTSGYKPLWAYFQYAAKYPDELGLQELQYIGVKLGFKPGWGFYKHKELQGKAKEADKIQSQEAAHSLADS